MSGKLNRFVRNRKVFYATFTAIVAVLIVYILFFNGVFFYFSFGLTGKTYAKAGDQKISMMAAKILLADEKSSFEKIYGNNVWSQKTGDVTMQDAVKDKVKTKLSRIVLMNKAAKDAGIVLSKDERSAVKAAAEEYKKSLRSDQIKSFKATEEQLEDMFTSFKIADKYYEYLTANMKVEVSEDEARVITIQYLSLTDENQAQEALEKLNAGTPFATVAGMYANGQEFETDVKRGELDQTLEDALYELKSGETSGVIAAGGKFVIARVTTDNAESKTDANLEKLTQERILQKFNESFEGKETGTFVETNNWSYNHVKWDDLPKSDKTFDEFFMEHMNTKKLEASNG